MNKRSDVHELIAMHPGITSAEIAQRLRLKIPAAEYHARGLYAEGYIRSGTQGGNRAPAEWHVVRELPDAEAAVQRVIPAHGAPALKRLGPSSVWELGARR